MDEVSLACVVSHLPVNDMVALRCTSSSFASLFDTSSVLEALSCIYPSVKVLSFTEFVDQYDATILDGTRSIRTMTDTWCLQKAIENDSWLGCDVVSKLIDRGMCAIHCMRSAIKGKSLVVMKHICDDFTDAIVAIARQGGDVISQMDQVITLSLATCDIEIIRYISQQLKGIETWTLDDPSFDYAENYKYSSTPYSDIVDHYDKSLMLGPPYVHGYLTGDWEAYNVACELYNGTVSSDKLYVAMYVKNVEYLKRVVEELKPTSEEVEARLPRLRRLHWEDGIRLLRELVR